MHAKACENAITVYKDIFQRILGAVDQESTKRWGKYRKMLAQTSLSQKSSLDKMKQGWYVYLGFSVASAVTYKVRLSTNDQHGAPEVIGSDMLRPSVLFQIEQQSD